MRVLINCSTLKGTGVVQVAASFITECNLFIENEYHIYLSPRLKSNLNLSQFGYNFHFYEFGTQNLYLPSGWNDIIKMRRLEKVIKPDVTFSVFGPSLWRPESPHIMGYAYPHYVYKDSPIFKLLSFKERLGIKIRELLHMYLLKHDGDYYICETDDVTKRLHQLYHIKEKNIFRVYNTASSIFLDYKSDKKKDSNSIFKFYTLCSPYRHKNLEILNEVIPELKRRGIKVCFYTTFRNDDYLRVFRPEIRDYICNVGPLSIAKCPELVDKSDALFLPTLLECYSASYPEAMCLRKPILTSKLPFAEEVCGKAAIYFDPLNYLEIADSIEQIITDRSIYLQLQEEGAARLKIFGTAYDRAFQYLEICKKIAAK